MPETDGKKPPKIFHAVLKGDARRMPAIPDDSIHLVLAAPPGWAGDTTDPDGSCVDLGASYEDYLDSLRMVWSEAFRVLIPGGRLICVAGDIWLSRKTHGRHRVLPLTSEISLMCRDIGFDNLSPIIWHKETENEETRRNPSTFLGSPYGPNGIIRGPIELILMQRKPGGYRKPTEEQRNRSRINKADYRRWFTPLWNVPPESAEDVGAGFPVEIAERLVRMYSFWGDTVLDPFCGMGTTLVAALRCDRSGIGVEASPDTCRMALNRIHEASHPLFNRVNLDFKTLQEFDPSVLHGNENDETVQRPDRGDPGPP